MTASRTNIFTCTVLAALLWTPAPRAEDDAIDSRVLEVVNAWAAHLKGLDAYQQTFTSSLTIEAEGMKNQMASTYAMAVEKPNRFAIVLKSGFNGITLVSDGEKLHTHVPMIKRYSEEDAPETLEDLAGNQLLATIGAGMGGFGPAQIFLPEDPGGSMLEGVTKAEYAGVEDLGGVSTHHLQFYQDEFDWEAWFTKTETPVLVKVKPDLTKAMEAYGEAMPGAMEGMKMETLLVFSDWKEGAVDESLFSFTPPEGANKVENLFEGMTGDEGEESEDEAETLVGSEALPFELELLDGGKFDLDTHKGKDVVVLDFWATWCPPCVRGLPKMAGVAAEFAGRGVVFCAVNQREEPKTIKKFLARKELDVPVALDRDGKVGTLYKVSGIPQTVVIDKGGKIADVHVGFAPGMETSLRETLAELIGAEE